MSVFNDKNMTQSSSLDTRTKELVIISGFSSIQENNKNETFEDSTNLRQTVRYKVLSTLNPFSIKALEYNVYAQGDTENDAIKKLYEMLKDIQELENGFIILPQSVNSV